jgi:hypothetical protein
MDMFSFLVYVYIFIYPYTVGPSKCPLYMNFLNCTLYYEYPCTYVHTVHLLYIFKILPMYILHTIPGICVCLLLYIYTRLFLYTCLYL